MIQPRQWKTSNPLAHWISEVCLGPSPTRCTNAAWLTSVGAEAATEFRKILSHRTVAATSVTHPLSQLGLARSYVLEGDTAKARTAYQDFLALWKDVDPDIPILKEAKAE